MEAYKVIEIKKSVFESNDREAEKLRAELKAEKTFLVNLMSSPGSGKTTTLRGIIGRLQQEMRIGVMEADIDSDVDAKTIADRQRPGCVPFSCIPAVCAIWTRA